MISKNNKGFGTYEMLTAFVVILIIIAIALAIVFRSNYKEKYDVMEYNARMFALSASNVSLETGDGGPYYLQMLIDSKLTSPMKSPFSGDKYCNPYASKVYIENHKKYITLECGNYLIYNQLSGKKDYTIYQFGSWKKGDSKDKDTQVEDFYNYIENDKKLFDKDLEKDAFLYSYNMENGTTYDDISDIPDQGNLVHEMRYRSLKKVN